MKTSITRTDSTTVVLRYEGDNGTTDGIITEEFSVPHGGGYVRDANGRQVCQMLSPRGNTLSVAHHDDLLPLIRREWRKLKQHERREQIRRGW